MSRLLSPNDGIDDGALTQIFMTPRRRPHHDFGSLFYFFGFYYVRFRWHYRQTSGLSRTRKLAKLDGNITCQHAIRERLWRILYSLVYLI